MTNFHHPDIFRHGFLRAHYSHGTAEQIPRPEPVHHRQRNESDPDSRDLESSSGRRFNVHLGVVNPSKMFARKRSRIDDDRDLNLVKINLEDHPEGFPRIAVYMNSDNDSVLARRFGNLHTRLILYSQVELTDLEAQLAKLDADDNSNEDTEWRISHSIHHRNGRGNEARKELVEKIAKKLKEYDDLVLRESQLRRLPRPSERVHRNFMDYIYQENAVGEDDQCFIYHEHDFVSLQEYEESWLDELLHRFMGHCRKGFLRRIFVKRADREKTIDKHIHYYSADRLGTFIKIIIAGISCSLLLIPVYIFICQNLSIKVMALIVLIFTFAFATAISFFTVARRQEVFAATAAYSAVLVVFIGNFQQRGWSSISSGSG